jgi:hypothetical protein
MSNVVRLLYSYESLSEIIERIMSLNYAPDLKLKIVKDSSKIKLSYLCVGFFTEILKLPFGKIFYI